jgi:glutathione S-transferase
MSSARRVLYDLAGADPALRFSPFCWRTRMALAHKGLEVETVPWRFTEKDVIAFSGQGRVPVLVDGDHVVSDSFAIALYLEETYPDRPSLFGGPGGVALSRFINTFADTVVQPWISRLIVSDILEVLHEKDRAYFRESREARFSRPLEEVTADRDAALPEFRAMLQPLRRHLQGLLFLGGEAPLYADYILFGGFQWARCASSFELLAVNDPIHAWRDRLLDLFEGLARGRLATIETLSLTNKFCRKSAV